MQYITNYINNLNLFQILDFIALIFGLLFIILLTKEKKLAFVFGFITSFISVYILLVSKVYLFAIVNFYYVAMAVYGYILWSHNEAKKHTFKITEYSAQKHIVIICLFSSVSILFYLLNKYVLLSKYELMDAFLSVFAFIATYLQVKKVLSGWLYWVILNAMSMVLFFMISSYGLSLMSVIYAVISIGGYFKWLRTYKNQV